MKSPERSANAVPPTRILAGPHAVAEALARAPGTVELVCLCDTLRPLAAQRIEEQARRSRVTVEIMPKLAIDQLAGEVTHQGVIAIAGEYPYVDLDKLFKEAAKEPHPLLVVLDQVQDPRNLGAVMRSAHAFGASGMIVLKDRAAQVTAAAVRSSAGASELVRVCRVTNLARALGDLKDRNYTVHGAVVRSATAVSDLDWSGPSALVLGNEGKGLRRLTQEHCDHLFTIPLVSTFDSLNVSAAAAIALYEASRHRLRKDDAAPL